MISGTSKINFVGDVKMEKLEVTSLSSRGQVVIPQDIRDHLKLKTGEKFVVLGDEDTVILKKIKMPSFKNFDKLLRKTQEFAKKRGIKPSDVREAIKSVKR